MYIDKEACTGCGMCLPYCPVDAIVRHRKNRETGAKSFSEIVADECVERVGRDRVHGGRG